MQERLAVLLADCNKPGAENFVDVQAVVPSTTPPLVCPFSLAVGSVPTFPVVLRSDRARATQASECESRAVPVDTQHTETQEQYVAVRLVAGEKFWNVHLLSSYSPGI